MVKEIRFDPNRNYVIAEYKNNLTGKLEVECIPTNWVISSEGKEECLWPDLGFTKFQIACKRRIEPQQGKWKKSTINKCLEHADTWEEGQSKANIAEEHTDVTDCFDEDQETTQRPLRKKVPPKRYLSPAGDDGDVSSNTDDQENRPTDRRMLPKEPEVPGFPEPGQRANKERSLRTPTRSRTSTRSRSRSQLNGSHGTSQLHQTESPPHQTPTRSRSHSHRPNGSHHASHRHQTESQRHRRSHSGSHDGSDYASQQYQTKSQTHRTPTRSRSCSHWPNGSHNASQRHQTESRRHRRSHSRSHNGSNYASQRHQTNTQSHSQSILDFEWQPRQASCSTPTPVHQHRNVNHQLSDRVSYEIPRRRGVDPASADANFSAFEREMVRLMERNYQKTRECYDLLKTLHTRRLVTEGIAPYQLPVTTEEEMNSLEEFLSNKDNHVNIIAFLSLKTDRDAGKTLNRIMATLMTNLLAEQYSYQGTRNGKKSFSDLQLRDIVWKAVLKGFPGTVDCTIENDDDSGGSQSGSRNRRESRRTSPSRDKLSSEHSQSLLSSGGSQQGSSRHMPRTSRSRSRTRDSQTGSSNRHVTVHDSGGSQSGSRNRSESRRSRDKLSSGHSQRLHSSGRSQQGSSRHMPRRSRSRSRTRDSQNGGTSTHNLPPIHSPHNNMVTSGTKPTREALDHSRRLLNVTETNTGLSEYEREMARLVIKNYKKMEYICVMLGTLIDRKDSNEGAAPFNLPVNTLEELGQLEEFLANGDNMKNLVNYLSKFVDRDCNKTVARIMENVMTNLLAEKFSYLGTRMQKRSFKELGLNRVVFRSALKVCPSTTDVDIEEALKYWLKAAKKRRLRHERNQEHELRNRQTV